MTEPASQRSVRAHELVADLRQAIEARESLLRAFLEQECDRLARACHAVADRFSRGGTLIVFGTGRATTDAAHVAVEFMHPVIVGKRALPALALSNDPTQTCTVTRIARPDDIAVMLTHEAPNYAASKFVEQANKCELLTIGMTGCSAASSSDYTFAVPSDDRDVVQEIHETTYHILWELVHTFMEQSGLLSDADKGDVQKSADTSFLYPFLDQSENNLSSVLCAVAASTRHKAEDVIALRNAIDVNALQTCALAIRARLTCGGRLIAFGNGGSSTDAQDVAADCLARGWPSIALTNDVATVTAVANDVGYDNVFVRQLIPLLSERDIVLAISTSGSSQNVIAGLDYGHRRGALTCAITGYGGGRLSELKSIDHLLVSTGDYVPRLQEVQATIYHLLLTAIGDAK